MARRLIGVHAKAEMLEEGFFIRTVPDEATGRTRTVVEFE